MFKLFQNLKAKEWILFAISCVFLVSQVWLDLKLPDYMSEITKLVQTSGSDMKDILEAGASMLLCALGSLLSAVIVGFSQGTITGIAVLIVCIIVQLIENYILQPVVMSKTTQLHPVTIMIGLLVFGHYFGILGMVIATPCIALLKVIFRFIVKKYDLFKDDEVFIKEVLKD